MTVKSIVAFGKALLPRQERIACTLFTAMLVTGLIAAVTATPVLAETHTFKVTSQCSINGTPLKPATYQIKLNDNGEAEIYRDSKMVVTAAVEVMPLTNDRNRGSILLAADGNIIEIRLEKQVVVFVR